jgi:hypothetical protein
VFILLQSVGLCSTCRGFAVLELKYLTLRAKISFLNMQADEIRDASSTGPSSKQEAVRGEKEGWQDWEHVPQELQVKP